MILSATSSRWQTVIADLSLILFLVAASALEDQPDMPAIPGTPAANAATTAEPVDIALTIWSDGPDSVALGEWLAEQTPHDGERLSITITYSAGRLAEAIARASATRQATGDAGDDARIIIAEGLADRIQVRLVQDDLAPDAPLPDELVQDDHRTGNLLPDDRPPSNPLAMS